MMELLRQLFLSLVSLLIVFLNPVILVFVIVILLILIKKNKAYKNDAYYQITKFPFLPVLYDKGRYGEYLTYKHLKPFESKGAKFLFNVYIPKNTGETTEIDVLMICSKGIFVFESKNYSGWIFGSEGQKNWYQTLPAGRGKSHKEHFYNPIMQNQSHIKHLKTFLGEQSPIQSIIVFSDRCTLKNVQVTSNDIRVINRHNVYSVVSKICDQMPTNLLSDADITAIYNKLYPFTQVDAQTKEQHIISIHNNLNEQPIQQDENSELPPVVPSSPVKADNTLSVIDTDTDSVNTETTPEDLSLPVEKSIEHTTIEAESNEQQTFKCPKCNSKLILRTATRGTNAGKQFYGCSTYPKCRYIQPVENELV